MYNQNSDSSTIDTEIKKLRISLPEQTSSQSLHIAAHNQLAGAAAGAAVAGL